MKFVLPDSLTELDTDALTKLMDDALAASKDLSGLKDEDITDEQLTELEELAAALDTIAAENASRIAVAEERTNRLAAARGAVESATAEPVEKEEVEAPVETEVESEPVVEQEKETVTASGVKRPVVAKAAGQAPEAPAPVARKTSMIAAADVPGFAGGQELTDMEAVTKAFTARLRGLPQTRVGNHRQRYGAAVINKKESEFTQGSRDFQDDYSMVMAAARESRLSGGSLVAAGGWCAPSETIYDILTLETIDGILDVPEVQVNRGGVRFTKGPDFSAIYAGTGFLQTEAMAEAGTVKPFNELECPEFEEVRLDAIGYGVKLPILTNAAYPELIKRFLEGTLVAHAHKVNVEVIGRIVAKLGAAIDYREFGSTTSDILGAVEFAAERLRYKFRMQQGASLEAFAPHWLKAAMRSDLSLRNGVELLSVSDQQITAFFSARNIRIQWVYDWQDLPDSGTGWPATAQIGIYPAGAFVKGATDVISLDAFYDSTELEVNMFTGAFFEEGISIMNTVGGGNLIEVSLDNAGRTGAADITSLVAAP